MERQILHIDVNNAFLSWTALELLKNGEKIDIRTIPAIIGGDEQKRSGIVLAKSMKAKQCGVCTGETIYQARLKCPNLQVYKGNYSTYKEYSNKMYKLLCEYTDKIERFSIDECFLDMTEYLMKDTLINKAKEISTRIKKELGFTVNVGVANNKLLAKMASDFTKPDRIHTLFKEEIPIKMWCLPVSELFMIGKKSVPKLYNMRIKTIGDLAKTDESILIRKFGKHGRIMWEYANGIDNSEVNYKEEKPKGIGNSVTLERDLVGLDDIDKIVLTLTEQVAYRLRKYNMVGKGVSVKLRTKDFQDFTHQGKLDSATSNTKKIYDKAKHLIAEMYKPGTFVRLVGVRVDNLTDKDEMQISFFDDVDSKKMDKLDETLDLLKEKYGYDKITLAGKMQQKSATKKIF